LRRRRFAHALGKAISFHELPSAAEKFLRVQSQRRARLVSNLRTKTDDTRMAYALSNRGTSNPGWITRKSCLPIPLRLWPFRIFPRRCIAPTKRRAEKNHTMIQDVVMTLRTSYAGERLT
jgi:hypothetical protein